MYSNCHICIRKRSVNKVAPIWERKSVELFYMHPQINFNLTYHVHLTLFLLQVWTEMKQLFAYQHLCVCVFFFPGNSRVTGKTANTKRDLQLVHANVRIFQTQCSYVEGDLTVLVVYFLLLLIYSEFGIFPELGVENHPPKSAHTSLIGPHTFPHSWQAYMNKADTLEVWDYITDLEFKI